MLLKPYFNGFFGQCNFTVIEVVVNNILKIFRVKEVDIVGLEHGFKLSNWLPWSLVWF